MQLVSHMFALYNFFTVKQSFLSIVRYDDRRPVCKVTLTLSASPIIIIFSGVQNGKVSIYICSNNLSSLTNKVLTLG